MVHARQVAGLYAIEVWRDAKRIGLIPEDKQGRLDWTGTVNQSCLTSPSAIWSNSAGSIAARLSLKPKRASAVAASLSCMDPLET